MRPIAILVLIALVAAAFVRAADPPIPTLEETGGPTTAAPELLLFTAEEWCVPCMRQAPAWNQVAVENPGLCRTIDLSDWTDQPIRDHPLAQQYGVTAVPSFVVVRGEKPVYDPWPAKVYGVDVLRRMVQVAREARGP